MCLAGVALARRGTPGRRTTPAPLESTAAVAPEHSG
jgi:hypothetical protein